jgi:UDP-N-acetylmuramate dehydrogenase
MNLGANTGDPARIAAAVEILGPRAEQGRLLAEFTTYRLGGPAAIYVEAHSVADLSRVALAHQTSGLEVLMIGRGSNLLIADSGFSGIAVRLVGGFEKITTQESDDQGYRSPQPVAGTHLKVGAAVALPVLARRSAAMGLQGMEWAVGVPGSVGGAVRMNAGGHGSDMARHLISVEVLDLRTGQVEVRSAESLGMRFRGSGLGDAEVVLSAVIYLEAGSVEDATARIAEIVRWRREHQPGGHNCGSVFVNPIPGELSAGEVIDRCGLRGTRRGGAVVSLKHANFIQAEESATAADVCELIDYVRSVVAVSTGIELRSEVRIVAGPEHA